MPEGVTGMAKLVFFLAFLLTVAAVETASAGPSFCTFYDGVVVCDGDIYFDGPAGSDIQ
jgi:hypothetical protein